MIFDFKPVCGTNKHCLFGAAIWVIVASYVSIQGQFQPNDNMSEAMPMEEMGFEGQLPGADERNRFNNAISYYNANERGGQLYKMRRYDDAKPFLKAGARLGFKMSQARLGAIYAYGLGSTERDAIRGIAWIGVAAAPRTDPAISKQYRDLLRQVPERDIAKIEALVAEARVKYDFNATGTKCRMIRSAGSHRSWLNCDVEDWDRFKIAIDNHNLCATQGLESGSKMELTPINIPTCM